MSHAGMFVVAAFTLICRKGRKYEWFKLPLLFLNSTELFMICQVTKYTALGTNGFSEDLVTEFRIFRNFYFLFTWHFNHGELLKNLLQPIVLYILKPSTLFFDLFLISSFNRLIGLRLN